MLVAKWSRAPLVRPVADFIKDRQTDVFLVSFPKAGRTWLRSILGYAIAKEYGLPESDVLDLWLLSKQVPAAPRIRVTHACDPHKKTPSAITLEGRKYIGKRVLFLARDPRDLLVSLYHHESNRRPALGMAGGPSASAVSELIDRHEGGLASLVYFYNLWAAPSGIDVAHLFYEDLHKDAAGVCRRAFDHMGLTAVSPSSIRYGIEQSRFDRMKQREAEGAVRNTALRRADASNPDSFKVRQGKVGSYRDHFSPAEIGRIEARLRQLKPPFDRYLQPVPLAGAGA
jgi:hypothetical protein